MPPQIRNLVMTVKLRDYDKLREIRVKTVIPFSGLFSFK